MAEFVATAGRIVRYVPRQAAFYGSGGTLFGIYLRNILLTLITLGVYYFWAKNRTRTYLVTQCEFEGDRFAWHGTGKELFKGALKLLVIGLPIAFLAFVVPVLWESVFAQLASQAVLFLVYVLLVPLASVASRRYRMTRVSWRGIRFSFRGRARDFFKVYLGGSFLTTITLGLYYPYWQTRIRKFMTDHSYFGNARFGFDGDGKALFGRFLALVAVIAGGLVFIGVSFGRVVMSAFAKGERAPDFVRALMGLIGPLLVSGAVVLVVWLWFAAFRHRYNWSHTTFGTARFRSTVTAGPLFLLALTNTLLTVITLGLAIPWVIVRNAKFYLANVQLDGPLDLTAILQEAQAAGATGESLADALDVDFGFELPL